MSIAIQKNVSPSKDELTNIINYPIHHTGGYTVDDNRAGDGERADCRQWREEGGERVAAVGVQRSRTVGKAHTGHRNRRTSWLRCRESCPLLVSTWDAGFFVEMAQILSTLLK